MAIPYPPPADAPPADDAAASRIDRLMDAIELVKANRRDEARQILRDLIREDSDFEEAWLWMSVAVDSLDQAFICLDNVLRVNPKHYEAAGALYRIRTPELEMERRRSHLRLWRDLSTSGLWLIIAGVLIAIVVNICNITAMMAAGGGGA